MKTVITDQNNIVRGFGDAVIDPETSKPIINGILLDSVEAAAVAEKKNLVTTKYNRANDAHNIAKMAHRTAMQAQEDEKYAETPEKKAEFAAIYKSRIAARDVKNKEYNNHMALAQAIVDEDLKPALEALAAKQKLLWEGPTVKYFEPRSGEHILTNVQYEALKGEYPIPAEKVLVFDSVTKLGAITADLRGITYWIDNSGTWDQGTIAVVGETLPTGAIRVTVLTEDQQLAISEQLETERISLLTQAKKDAEKQIAIDNATANSINLRSQYELQGKTSSVALADAQAWLAAEIVIIEAKYV